MTARREIDRLKVEAKISAWMTKHHGTFWRVPDIANAVNESVPAVNTCLRGMHERGAIDMERRRKRRNGKKIPYYKMVNYSTLEAHPHWLAPTAPVFTPEQLKGARTVLGFTGDLETKKLIGMAGIGKAREAYKRSEIGSIVLHI